MTNGSSIPGPKPPAAAVNRETSSASLIDPLNSLIPSPLKDSPQRESDIAANRIDQILNRPTAEILQEASAVASYTIEDSKTVGALGVNLLTVGALLVASPWSWIAMLLFGPVRVWRFFYSGVIGGIGSALGLAIFALFLLSAGIIFFLGWIILRAIN
jgi:hypothetical protein